MPKMIESIRATEIKKQGNGQASLSIDLSRYVLIQLEILFAIKDVS